MPREYSLKLKTASLVGLLALMGAGCSSTQTSVVTQSKATSTSEVAPGTHGSLDSCYVVRKIGSMQVTAADADQLSNDGSGCHAALTKRVGLGLDPCSLDIADPTFVAVHEASNAAIEMCDALRSKEIAGAPSVQRKLAEGWTLGSFVATTTDMGERVMAFNLSASPVALSSYVDMSPPSASQVDADNLQTLKKFGQPKSVLAKSGEMVYLNIMGLFSSKSGDALLSPAFGTGERFGFAQHGIRGLRLIKDVSGSNGFVVQEIPRADMAVRFDPSLDPVKDTLATCGPWKQKESELQADLNGELAPSNCFTQ